MPEYLRYRLVHSGNYSCYCGGVGEEIMLFFCFSLFIFVHLKSQQHNVSKHQIGTAVTAAHLKELLGAYGLRPQ